MIMKKSSLGKKFFYLPQHTAANSQNGIAAVMCMSTVQMLLYIK